MSEPAFSRAEPDARRQSLIEATVRVLAERGAGGISVRHVAVAAGVSPGLVNHYFNGIDDLIAETYAYVGAHVTGALNDALDAAENDPRARLNAYVGANFSPPIADPELLSTWIAFWSLMRTRPRIALLHEQQYAAYRNDIATLLKACGMTDARQLQRHSIAITALIDGLWLELCLSPRTFTPVEACAIVQGHIELVLTKLL